ncbi:hypothetical protein [Winogradskyella sp. R77965]|uniref:hypothetical protein n=1 Tax=Winogradskyella sp. R77965 TaxID=3093872 RepID=UPI0037DBF166
MKNLIKTIVITLLLTNNLLAQEITKGYFPEYEGNVSKVDYDYGKNILTNAYSQIPDNEECVYADYWNVASAYARMGVNSEIVYSYIKKAKELDTKSFCEIVTYFQTLDEGLNRFKKLLGDSFTELISDCSGTVLKPASASSFQKKKEGLDMKKYDETLIDKIIFLLEKDNRYRYSSKEYHANLDKQTKLDSEVRLELSKIFDDYGYPSIELVSEEFSNYGCLLLEHSGDIETYDKYFPLVAKAFKNGDVTASMFRMLIDRIHWRKTGNQIFGSHSGKPFADEKTIARIKEEYGL